MDILKLKKEKIELAKCEALIQLQQEKIKELVKKVEHLEELLLHRAEILDFNKE